MVERQMKDSGIAWAKQIPIHWKVLHNKYIMSKVKSICSVYKGEDILSLTINGVIVRDLDGGGKMPSSFDGYQYVQQGNLLMCLFDIDVTPRCVGIVKQNGITSPAYSQFKMKRLACANYYYYYYLMLDYTKELLHLAKNLRHSLTEEQLGAIKQVVPSLDEQKRIANFLDKKCEKIDGLKADIQAQIDLLEQYKRSVITESVTHGLDLNTTMKDSGVDYIDKIKADWKISKIGFVCIKLARGFSEEEPALICSNKGSIVFRDEQHVCGKMISEDNAMQGIHIGDIAIHGMDTWHGAIGFSKIRGKITRVVHVCDSMEDKRFIVYYLKSLAYQGVYKLISNGIRGNTSDFRSWDKVKDIYICLPPLDEQKAIADYLDHKCAEIDQIIADKKAQLDMLDEYKKSLIYEYITGKKVVR